MTLRFALVAAILVPVVGVAGAVLVRGESLTLATVVGGVVTIAGVAVIQFRRSAPAVGPAS